MCSFLGHPVYRLKVLPAKLLPTFLFNPTQKSKCTHHPRRRLCAKFDVLKPPQS